MADYLAIILIGGGSSWGRSPDKETAIKNALYCIRDWRTLFEVSNIEITVNVVDVQGYKDVAWSPQGFIGTNEQTGKEEKFDRPIESVKRITPKLKKQAA